MSDAMQKDEVCEECVFKHFSLNEEPCVDCSTAFSGRQKNYYEERYSPQLRECQQSDPLPLDVDWSVMNKEVEKEYLAKLIDDHWSYISKLIDVTQMHLNPKEKAIAEFHYRTAAVHFWKHAMEYVEEKV